MSEVNCRVKGIVMAVGSISEVKAVRVIDDQNVFHADANIQQIVFRSVFIYFYIYVN